MNESKCFEILYSQFNQKDSWLRGYLLISLQDGWVWLKDINKLTLRKGSMGQTMISSFLSNYQTNASAVNPSEYKSIFSAGFHLKLVKEVQNNRAEPLSSESLPQCTSIINEGPCAAIESSLLPSSASTSTDQQPSISTKMPTDDQSYSKRRSDQSEPTSKSAKFPRSNSNGQTASEGRGFSSSQTAAIAIPPSSRDPTLTKPTIPEALQAILRPHQSSAVSKIISCLCSDLLTSASASTNTSANTSVRVSSEVDFTGAILADEVGTGKTLVALAVIQSICRGRRCKAVVVCPATLVRNWEQEIVKWFTGSLSNTALFVYSSKSASVSGGPDAAVHDFLTAHPSSRPVLVICYEMFRTFAEAFNTCRHLELLVCDEGHRLKNSLGTKTSLALGNCIAVRRLVMTGTPIQNNMDELFAVVQFALPGFLGPLKQFQSQYRDVIGRGQAGDAAVKDIRMAAEASRSLRTRLASVFVRASEMQLQEFRASRLPPRHEHLVYVAWPTGCPEARRYEVEVDAMMAALRGPEDPGVDPGDHGQTSVTAAATASARSKTIKLSQVLPTLTRLRLLVTVGDAAISSVSVEERRQAASVKLHAVEHLLSAIRTSYPDEKVVVVSNFTACLDAIQVLCQGRRWKTLRIDGEVQESRRALIVKHFNRPSEGSPADTALSILLLSAKAGGVGLNLIGANRLILLEPDWNPATDRQAAGRIYREGQTKPVHIYRFVCVGTIEETILQRQREKAKLSDALMHDAVDDHDKGSASLPAPIVGAMKRKSRGKASGGDDSERGTHDDSVEDEKEEEYVEGETNIGSRGRVSNGSAGDAAADVMTQSVPVGRLLLMVRPVAHVSCCTRTTAGSTAAGDYTCLATLHACICCSASATSNLQTEASADVEVV